MTVIIWHNPRCSKSRATLALLQERGVTPRIMHYLDEPPAEAEIKDVLGKLGMPARGLMREGENAYKSLNLSDPALSEAALIRAMAENPILIERPVVIKGSRAALGRPPEAVLDIL